MNGPLLRAFKLSCRLKDFFLFTIDFNKLYHGGRNLNEKYLVLYSYRLDKNCKPKNGTYLIEFVWNIFTFFGPFFLTKLNNLDKNKI